MRSRVLQLLLLILLFAALADGKSMVDLDIADSCRSCTAFMEILEQGGDPDEFLEHAKLEMFSDQVYCFTPNGDLISLPAGATPLDFAYAVHTELGHTTVAAKINGRERPLRTQLRNGDVVQIVKGGVRQPPLVRRL